MYPLSTLISMSSLIQKRGLTDAVHFFPFDNGSGLLDAPLSDQIIEGFLAKHPVGSSHGNIIQVCFSPLDEIRISSIRMT